MDFKHIGVLVVAVAAIAIISGCTSTPTESGITRAITPSTVAPGGTITVTLTVNVNDERFYIIEEIPPSELSVIDVGDFKVDPQGHIKWVQLQDAADTTYTLTMKAPDTAGSYTFTGIYQMDGMDNPADIAGPSTVTVS